MLHNEDGTPIENSIEEMALLLQKHVKGELSAEEQQRLDLWLNESEHNRQVLSNLTDENNLIGELKSYSEFREKVNQDVISHEPEMARVVDLFSKKTTRHRWLVAASIILLISAGSYFLFTTNRVKKVAAKSEQNLDPKKIFPAADVAILTLEDGSTVFLDSTKDGLVANQHGTTVRKNSRGELIYSKTAHTHGQLSSLFNKIATPRGGKYRLTLPDGSAVWLNAASSLRFPVAFAGQERRVELSGEAYFEVSHNPSMPFKVSLMDSSNKPQGEVTVLGTHFDAKAYNDEPQVNVALLQGSVRVSKTSPNTIPIVKTLVPGQSATYDGAGKGIAVNDLGDPQSSIAWVNERFLFEHDSFASMIREFSRWYNVDFVYERNIPYRAIIGEVSRKMPLSDLLDALEQMGGVHFKVEGNKVRILP